MGDLPTAESLPAALATREQWVGWRIQERDGKKTKVPINPATGHYASATDSDTWTDFATAREHATDGADGVGFVFTQDDPIVGVDLDDCRDPDDGTLADWAHDIITRLDSFSEISPSGTGVHVLVKGELPDGRNRHGDVELYDDARFFTVTGDHMSETPATVETRQDALTAVHREYVAEGDPSEAADRDADTADVTEAATDDGEQGSRSGPGNDLGDQALLEQARNAASGEKFQRLWRGITAGYPSQSEADMALCSLLAFWTGGDADQMDRLFRESGLMRPKWDEQHYADGATYGERTIKRAIAGTDEFYTVTGGSDEGMEGTRSLDVSSDSELESTSAGQRETGSGGVPVDVVEDLEAELRRLHDENEELRAELEAERARRKELEGALEQSEASDSASWWRQLFG